MKPILAAILLLLAACGGASRHLVGGDGIARVQVVWGDPAPTPYGRGALGYASPLGGGLWRVTINRVVADIPMLRAYIMAHELGHVAGLDHSPEATCLMSGSALVTSGGPCAAEAAYLAAWGEGCGIEIVECPPDLVDAVVAAIAIWNTPSAFEPFGGQGLP